MGSLCWLAIGYGMGGRGNYHGREEGELPWRDSLVRMESLDDSSALAASKLSAAAPTAEEKKVGPSGSSPLIFSEFSSICLSYYPYLKYEKQSSLNRKLVMFTRNAYSDKTVEK